MKRLSQAGLALLMLATTAGAQDSLRSRGVDPLAKLDPHTRTVVETLLDSARLAGLPTEPIESKALEGISKRASGRLIVLRVRETLHTLRSARAALGPQASADELVAASGALRVGLTGVELSQLARSRSTRNALTVPLVVLSDLISRGVPRDTASTTIFQLWQRGAADDDFLGLWRGVERDIVSGTDPGVALLNRAREVPSRGPPPTTAPPARQPESSENVNR